MQDDPYAQQPLARWFWAGAIASLLFMALGCWGYIMDVTASEVPVDRRALYEARPVWQIAAYAVAVWVGLVGSLLLLLRRKLAEPLLLVSLIAAFLTFLPYAITQGVRENITTGDIVAALVVLAVTWTIYWFARHSRQRGWLA